MLVGAYEELRTSGVPHGETLALLRKVTRQAAKSFRPPSGGWTPDAIDEVIDSKFAKAKADGQNFVLLCFAQATDDASLERLLKAAMKNFLADEAKSTFRGKLRRRLAGLFDKDGRFEHGTVLTPSWAITGHGAIPWAGDCVALVAAAFSIRGYGFRIDDWNTSGPTKRAVKGPLLDVSHAVLSAAAAAVREEALAEVVEERFPALKQLAASAEPSDIIGEAAAINDNAPSGYSHMSTFAEFPTGLFT